MSVVRTNVQYTCNDITSNVRFYRHASKCEQFYEEFPCTSVCNFLHKTTYVVEKNFSHVSVCLRKYMLMYSHVLANSVTKTTKEGVFWNDTSRPNKTISLIFYFELLSFVLWLSINTTSHGINIRFLFIQSWLKQISVIKTNINEKVCLFTEENKRLYFTWYKGSN